MNKNTKLIGGTFLFLVTLFLITMYITDYMNGLKIGLTDVFVFVLLLASWFQFMTWGSDPKVQKDELGKNVSTTSAKLSYFILTGCLFILWIIDRVSFVSNNEFGNVPLFIALCFAVMLFPVIQFFLSRKYV
ncbi:hypothetical protein P6709_06760 [Jeotgalibacillus sp. ET6]|uniref:hypothetical protein n=1 Tax=Jeotgalibacillus sp. ET6 TaxID=3037260 RepID=UPI0024185CCA|nr:hypothetical protein [Jeotgalibacillus sp. ET6]MDG5471442.1 hypothetical protein [Jeotgalibacillus sp. ET6]